MINTSIIQCNLQAAMVQTPKKQIVPTTNWNSPESNEEKEESRSIKRKKWMKSLSVFSSDDCDSEEEKLVEENLCSLDPGETFLRFPYQLMSDEDSDDNLSLSNTTFKNKLADEMRSLSVSSNESNNKLKEQHSNYKHKRRKTKESNVKNTSVKQIKINTSINKNTAEPKQKKEFNTCSSQKSQTTPNRKKYVPKNNTSSQLINKTTMTADYVKQISHNFFKASPIKNRNTFDKSFIEVDTHATRKQSTKRSNKSGKISVGKQQSSTKKLASNSKTLYSYSPENCFSESSSGETTDLMEQEFSNSRFLASEEEAEDPEEPVAIKTLKSRRRTHVLSTSCSSSDSEPPKCSLKGAKSHFDGNELDKLKFTKRNKIVCSNHWLSSSENEEISEKHLDNSDSKRYESPNTSRIHSPVVLSQKNLESIKQEAKSISGKESAQPKIKKQAKYTEPHIKPKVNTSIWKNIAKAPLKQNKFLAAQKSYVKKLKEKFASSNVPSVELYKKVHSKSVNGIDKINERLKLCESKENYESNPLSNISRKKDDVIASNVEINLHPNTKDISSSQKEQRPSVQHSLNLGLNVSPASKINTFETGRKTKIRIAHVDTRQYRDISKQKHNNVQNSNENNYNNNPPGKLNQTIVNSEKASTSGTTINSVNHDILGIIMSEMDKNHYQKPLNQVKKNKKPMVDSGQPNPNVVSISTYSEPNSMVSLQNNQTEHFEFSQDIQPENTLFKKHNNLSYQPFPNQSVKPDYNPCLYPQANHKKNEPNISNMDDSSKVEMSSKISSEINNEKEIGKTTPTICFYSSNEEQNVQNLNMQSKEIMDKNTTKVTENPHNLPEISQNSKYFHIKEVPIHLVDKNTSSSPCVNQNEKLHDIYNCNKSLMDSQDIENIPKTFIASVEKGIVTTQDRNLANISQKVSRPTPDNLIPEVVDELVCDEFPFEKSPLSSSQSNKNYLLIAENLPPTRPQEPVTHFTTENKLPSIDKNLPKVKPRGVRIKVGGNVFRIAGKESVISKSVNVNSKEQKETSCLARKKITKNMEEPSANFDCNIPNVSSPANGDTSTSSSSSSQNSSTSSSSTSDSDDEDILSTTKSSPSSRSASEERDLQHKKQNLQINSAEDKKLYESKVLLKTCKDKPNPNKETACHSKATLDNQSNDDDIIVLSSCDEPQVDMHKNLDIVNDNKNVKSFRLVSEDRNSQSLQAESNHNKCDINVFYDREKKTENAAVSVIGKLKVKNLEELGIVGPLPENALSNASRVDEIKQDIAEKTVSSNPNPHHSKDNDSSLNDTSESLSLETSIVGPLPVNALSNASRVDEIEQDITEKTVSSNPNPHLSRDNDSSLNDTSEPLSLETSIVGPLPKNALSSASRVHEIKQDIREKIVSSNPNPHHSRDNDSSLDDTSEPLSLESSFNGEKESDVEQGLVRPIIISKKGEHQYLIKKKSSPVKIKTRINAGQIFASKANTKLSCKIKKSKPSNNKNLSEKEEANESEKPETVTNTQSIKKHIGNSKKLRPIASKLQDNKNSPSQKQDSNAALSIVPAIPITLVSVEPVLLKKINNKSSTIIVSKSSQNSLPPSSSANLERSTLPSISSVFSLQNSSISFNSTSIESSLHNSNSHTSKHNTLQNNQIPCGSVISNIQNSTSADSTHCENGNPAFLVNKKNLEEASTVTTKSAPTISSVFSLQKSSISFNSTSSESSLHNSNSHTSKHNTLQNNQIPCGSVISNIQNSTSADSTHCENRNPTPTSLVNKKNLEEASTVTTKSAPTISSVFCSQNSSISLKSTGTSTESSLHNSNSHTSKHNTLQNNQIPCGSVISNIQNSISADSTHCENRNPTSIINKENLEEASTVTTKSTPTEDLFFKLCDELFTEVVSLKIPKLVDDLHLVITHDMIREERLKKIYQLKSSETIKEEKRRTEKDFNETLRIRGQAFVPLFMTIVNKIKKENLKSLVIALYCRITQELVKVDPIHQNYILKLRDLIKKMLIKNNEKPEIISIFNDKSFCINFYFVERLLAKYYLFKAGIQCNLTVECEVANSSQLDKDPNQEQEKADEDGETKELLNDSQPPENQKSLEGMSAVASPPVGNLDQMIFGLCSNSNSLRRDSTDK